MDGTIITTKSGRVFPKDDNDWKFLYDSSITKLQKISETPDAKLAIITNQAGIENGSTKITSFKTKIETIARQIGVPLLVFVLPGKNEYRKPLPTVWNNLLVSVYNAGVSPDMTTSLYCGDAAGRKKDHSKVDRLFAMNIGVPFLTPEEFFLGQKPQPFTMPTFDPKQYLDPKETNDHIDFPHKLEVKIKKKTKMKWFAENTVETPYSGPANNGSFALVVFLLGPGTFPVFLHWDGP